MKNLLSLCVFIFPIMTVFSQAADFNVTSPGFFYRINNQEENPEITLTRGQTYTFAIATDEFHPFAISTSDFNFDVPGVTNNNINAGTITYAVPFDAPDLLQYLCSIHGFGAVIHIIDPPLPPAVAVKIISVSLTSSNVTLKSTGTNGFVAVPEFRSNLFSGNWTTVPSFTNTFTSGTNTSVFGRLEVICGPTVFLRVRNNPAP